MLAQRREFNELTRITLEKAERGEDLLRYDSFEDFLAEVKAEEEAFRNCSIVRCFGP